MKEDEQPTHNMLINQQHVKPKMLFSEVGLHGMDKTPVTPRNRDSQLAYADITHQRWFTLSSTL